LLEAIAIGAGAAWVGKNIVEPMVTDEVKDKIKNLLPSKKPQQQLATFTYSAVCHAHAELGWPLDVEALRNILNEIRKTQESISWDTWANLSLNAAFPSMTFDAQLLQKWNRLVADMLNDELKEKFVAEHILQIQFDQTVQHGRQEKTLVEIHADIDDIKSKLQVLMQLDQPPSEAAFESMFLSLITSNNERLRKDYLSLCKMQGIDETILSDVSHLGDKLSDSRYRLEDVLQDSLGEEDRTWSEGSHFYIIGEGGMGKTTASLNFYTTSKDSLQSMPSVCFVFRLNQLTHKVLDTESALHWLKKLVDKDNLFFKPSGPFPLEYLARFLEGNDTLNPYHTKFFLLLDGLNEVNDPKLYDDLLEMISQLESRRYDCLRIVITSRRSVDLVRLHSFNQFQMRYLREEQIINYLRIHNNDAYLSLRTLTSRAQFDLLQLLKIPMMLTLFNQQRTEGEGLSHSFVLEQKTKGDLLHNYFLREVYKAKRLKKEAIFVVDFLFPLFAKYMCDNGELHELEDKGFVVEVLLDRAKSDFEKATVLSSEYTFSYIHQEDDESGWSVEYDQVGSLKKKSLNDLLNSSNLALGQGKTIRFSHQYFRDYLAAQYYRQHITSITNLFFDEYATQDERKECVFSLKQLLSQRFLIQRKNLVLQAGLQISADVLRFLGEISGEANRVPTFNTINGEWSAAGQKTVIEKCFDILRDDFSVEAAETINALISACILARDGNLAGIDLSRLNLSKTQLNGRYFDDNSTITGYSLIERRFSVGTIENKRMPTHFDGALLEDGNLMPRGHGTSIDQFIIVPGDEGYDQVYSFGGDAIMLHDFRCGTIRRFPYSGSRIVNASLIGDGQYLVACDKRGQFSLWKRNLHDNTLERQALEEAKPMEITIFGMIPFRQGLLLSLRNEVFFAELNVNDSSNKLIATKIFRQEDTDRIILHEHNADRFYFSCGCCIYEYIVCTKEKRIVYALPLIIDGCFSFSSSIDIDLREKKLLLINNFAQIENEWLLAVKCELGYILLQCDVDYGYINVIDYHPLAMSAQDLEDDKNRFHYISQAHDGNFLVTAFDGMFYAYSLKNDRPATKEKTYVGHNTTIRRVWKADYLRHGISGNDVQKYAIISIGNDRSMRLWNLSDPWAIDVLHGQYSGFRTFRKIKGKPGYYIAALYNEKISVWHETECTDEILCLSAFSGHSDWVWCADAVMASDGKVYGVSGAQDSKIKLWDLSCGCEIDPGNLEQHRDKVESVCFSDDGHRILSTGGDGRVLLHTRKENASTWVFETTILSDVSSHKEHQMKCAVFSPDESSVFAGGNDGITCELLFDDPGRKKSRMYQFNGWARSIQVSFHGETLLVSGGRYALERSSEAVQCNDEADIHCATLWKVGRTDHPIAVLLGMAQVNYAVFSPDEKYVLTALVDSSILIYSIAQVQPLDVCIYRIDPIVILKHTDQMFHIEWAWDERYFYATSLNGFLYRWDFQDILLRYEQSQSEEVFTLDAATDAKHVQNISGFLYHGSSFKNLHTDSKISDDVIAALRTQECEVSFCEG